MAFGPGRIYWGMALLKTTLSVKGATCKRSFMYCPIGCMSARARE